MRLLFVEDDREFSSRIIPRLQQIAGTDKVAVARSRDSALAEIKNNIFDAFVLDLRLPPYDDDLNDEIEHGAAVFRQAATSAPGTPVYFLTGSKTEDLVNDFLANSDRLDLWGNGQIVPSVKVFRKNEPDLLLSEIAQAAEQIRIIDDIEVVPRGEIELSAERRRVIRVFTRKQQGTSCEVRALSGGLSSSQVVRVVIRDRDGAFRLTAVGKLGDIQDVDSEVESYNRHVVRLGVGAFPQYIDRIRAGVGTHAGAFYRLADDHNRSLFNLLASDQGEAAKVVEYVRERLKPWTHGFPARTMTVGQIRQRLVSNEKAHDLWRIYNLNWAQEIEERTVQASGGCLHGDLHGGNILVDIKNNPVLIDFGDVGDGASAIDPLTLELCCLFHPSQRELRGTWPSAAVAGKWHDLDSYLVGCSCPDFIRACRTWATETAVGNRELYSVAYAYLLRQLKYPETNKDLALTILDGVRIALQSTF